jgi:hypothetical protein
MTRDIQGKQVRINAANIDYVGIRINWLTVPIRRIFYWQRQQIIRLRWFLFQVSHSHIYLSIYQIHLFRRLNASILSSWPPLPNPMMRYIAHRFFIIHSSTTSFVFCFAERFLYQRNGCVDGSSRTW